MPTRHSAYEEGIRPSSYAGATGLVWIGEDATSPEGIRQFLRPGRHPSRDSRRVVEHFLPRFRDRTVDKRSVAAKLVHSPCLYWHQQQGFQQ